jgi:BexC/CtrB/KpsE family polysaccharide export inner-membrane protein
MLETLENDDDIFHDRAVRPAPPLRRDALRRRRRRSMIFSAVFLLLPSILAVVYFYGICSDIFSVDTTVLIRGPAVPSAPSGGGAPGGGGGGLLGGSDVTSGMTRAIDESYAVVQFIQSREGFRLVASKLGYIKRYSDPNIDWLHRLPADTDFETAYRNYGRHVSAYYDDIEGQVNLNVWGFSAETSYLISKELTDASERLVNEFNERAKHDFIALAETQVERKHEAVTRADTAMRDFRISRNVIDPTLISTELGSVITTLTSQAATVQANLDAVQRLGLSAAGAAPLRNQIVALRQEIDRQQQRLTGNNGPLAAVLADFAAVSTAQSVAQQEYLAAVQTRDNAIFEASKKALYVVDVVPSRVPEEAQYPKRWLDVLLVICTTIGVWVVWRILLAAVRDHMA